MIRKIKGLGLAFVAIAAMSMAAASAASASQLHATTAEPDASIFGQQSTQHIFSTDSGTVKCKSATFEGTAEDTGQSSTQLTEDELQVTATYTECQAFGQAAVIDMNGCKFTITGTQSGTGHTTAGTAYVDVTGCTTGQHITITPQLNCTVTVPEQHNLSHLVFTNEAGSPHDVKVNVTVTGITYEPHGECPSVAHDTTLTHNGQYTGQATFQAREDEGSAHATHNGHEYLKLNQNGALIGLEAT